MRRWCRLADKRTHYQILGVSQVATADEVRAAFRSRARELHSDSNAQISLAAQQLAVVELARVSEAWRVLNDPQKRLEYDHGPLQTGRVSSPASPPRPHAGSGFPAARPTRASVGIVDAPSTTRPLIVIAGLILVISIVVILIVHNSASTSDTPNSRLQVGACVLVVATTAGKSLHAVDCAGHHDGTITQLITNFGPCLGTEDSYSIPPINARICVSPV